MEAPTRVKRGLTRSRMMNRALGLATAVEPLGKFAVGTTTAQSERELAEFRELEGLGLRAEIARLRHKLRQTESEAQRAARKNRVDMERLVRRITEEHMLELWTKRFRTTSPFVSELPSCVIRGGSCSTGSSETRRTTGGSPGGRELGASARYARS